METESICLERLSEFPIIEGFRLTLKSRQRGKAYNQRAGSALGVGCREVKTLVQDDRGTGGEKTDTVSQ